MRKGLLIIDESENGFGDTEIREITNPETGTTKHFAWVFHPENARLVVHAVNLYTKGLLQDVEFPRLSQRETKVP